MVDLLTNGGVNGTNVGGDIRSIIKNATSDPSMSGNNTKTIMNKEELDNKRVDAEINNEKLKVQPFTNVKSDLQNIKDDDLGGTNKIGANLNDYRGNKIQDVRNNIGADEKRERASNVTVDEEKAEQRQQQSYTALGAYDDFVESVRGSIDRGEEDRLTIENIRAAFPEFESLDESQIRDLTRGVYNASKLGTEYSLYDFAVKHPELMIEFNTPNDLGLNGKADLLEAMFSPDSGAYDRPGLAKILSFGLLPNELGTLDTTTYDEAGEGEKFKTFLQNSYKSLWNAVALTYNFLTHPLESAKSMGSMALSLGTSKALKKSAEKAGVSRDEWVNQLIDEMGDGSSFKDKITKWLINSGDMGEMTRDYFKTTYGTVDGFKNYLYTDPAGVISDIMTLVEAGAGLAGKMGIIEKATAKSIMKTVSWLDPYQAPGKVLLGSDDILKIGGKQIKNVGVLPELAKIEGKAVKGTLKATGKVSKRVMEFVANKLTGLSEESRKFIKENPDLAMDYIKGEMWVEDIVEKIQSTFDDILSEKKQVGEFYDFMKKNENIKIKTSGVVSEIKGMLGDLGIKVSSDGTLEFGKLSYSPSQQRQLQQVYNYVNALGDLGDNASVKDVRRARQLIDGLANWEGNSRAGLDAEVMNSIRDMRGRVDNALKEQVQGFKEADKEYSSLLKSIKELKRDWFNKDGTVKDNIESKVRNLSNRANEKKLERLEKYIPDIRKDAQALGVAEAVDKATKMNVGQYLQQGLMGGGLMALLSGNITGKAIFSFLGLLGVTTPKNFVRVLAKIGKGEEWVKNVGDRIMNGLKLSKEQENSIIKLLDRNREEIMANPEKYIDLIEEGEYAKGQNKAYLGAESTEKKLSEKERASLIKKYTKGSKNNGFVMRVVRKMGEGEHGMADLDNKLIKLESNLGDTTAQHEFFHALFSVVDEDTKRYVLDEAKHYLGLSEDKYSKLGKEEASRIVNNAAEEWLAESFGIYARRKEIKLGEIKLKGNRLQRFKSRVRDLFQRAYEWIQDYSMDRETINKLFNEVYGAVDGKVLDETGKFNLAEKLGINEKNSKLGGLNESKGLRYKKTGKNEGISYNTTANEAQHDGLGKKTPLTAVRGQNFNDSGLFGGNKDGKGHYIVKGGREKQLIYTKVNKNGKAKFSGYKMDLQEKNRKYYDNVVNALNRFEKKGYNYEDILIGKTPRGKDIYITDKDLVHIFKEHGEFYIENLIESVNDGRDGFWEIENNKNYKGIGLRPRMEIEIPGKNEKFIVGLMSDGSDEFNSTRYNVKSLRESKPSQVESRGGVKFKKDIYNDKGYTKPEYRYDPRSSLPTVRGGWTKAKIEKYLRNSASSSPKGVYSALSAIREFDSVEDFKNHVFYHGTQGAFVGRPTMSIPEKTFDKYADRFGGGYGQRYWAISLTTDKKIASNFGGASSNVNINPVILRKDAKVIEMPQLTDSIELDSHIEKLWNDGVDAVWIGDKNAGEKELAVINPKAIVNVDNADSYRVYHLGMNDNPLKISTDADFKRIYDDAPRLQDEIDTTLKAYMDYEKEGLAKKGVEKYEIGEEGWLEKSKKEREAKNEIREEEGYQGLYRKYLDAKSNARNEVRWKKDNTGRELSKGQQEYFKDSKITDGRGKLLKVYHGTHGDFTVFDRNRIGETTNNKGIFGEGFYMTSKESFANMYAGKRYSKEGLEGKVMEGYVNIKKPFMWNDYKGEEALANLRKELGLGKNVIELNRLDNMIHPLVKPGQSEKFRAALEKAGYDGVVFKYPKGGGDEIVAFNSNQFKNIDNLNPTKSEDIRYKKGWHGSPADFKKFDSSHMSEGEGAQVHGWGHYVAVDRNTAKGYAEMKGADFEYKGKKLDGRINYSEQSVEERVANQIYGELKDGKKWDVAIKNLKGYAEGWIRDFKRKAENAENDWMRDYYKESMKEEIDGLKMLDKMKEEDFVNKGGRNLYNVEIPDPVKRDTPTGSNYLEEDGKITYQQIEKLAEGLVDYDERGNWGKNAFLSNIVNDLEDLSGGWDDKLDKYVTKGNMSGKKLYEHLVDYFGGREKGEKQASKFLESMGYDGIHYFGGRDGEAYVIFGDDNAQIKSHIRYKKDQTETPEFKNWFGKSIAKADNGGPKVLYHGTVGKFDAFDRNRVGSNAQRLGPGFYFTNDKKVAKEYTTRLNSLGEKVKYAGDEPNIKEVYVSLQNPLRFNEELVDEKAIKKVLMEGDKDYYFNNTIPFKVKNNEFLGKKWTREEVERLPKSKKVDLMLEYAKRGINKKDYGRLNENLLAETTMAFNNKGDVLDYLMKYTGKDGVYAKDWKGTEQYVTWSEGQQKYTNNVGTFDRNNPDMRYKKDYNWNREDMKKELVKRANEGFYDDLKKEYDGFLDDVTKNSGGYPVKAPLKYGSNGVDFSEKGKKGNRILDKGVNKKGGLNDVNDIVRGTIRVSNLNDIDKVVDYVKKNYKNVTDFDDKYRNPTPMGYVDYSFLYEGKNGAKAEVQVNVTEMIVAKEKLKDALNYGITEKEYNDIAKRSGTKGGGLGHTFYDEIRMIRKKLDEKGLSSNERKMLLGRIKVLSKQSVDYYKSYMDLVKGKL